MNTYTLKVYCNPFQDLRPQLHLLLLHHIQQHSLRYLPVSFNKAIGATTPFFITIFAFVITCKKEIAKVYLALLLVVFRIVLVSNNEPLFHLFRFLVCVDSSVGHALKSAV
ncbi:sugar phosphate/phosphate translocator [Spatholobus suberectus]|nr:sugar phosphate/phosphate translocator [Spatholobus suberectus]